MRLERRREERLVDRAKRRSVASLKKGACSACGGGGGGGGASKANATAKTKGTAKSE